MSLFIQNPSDLNRLRCQFAGFLQAPHFIPKGETCGAFLPDGGLELDKVSLTDFPAGMRIGHRAEVFFQTAIRAEGRFESVDAHIQVIQDGLTLGELDFLLRERQSQKVIHVELAYKFYLFDPDVDATFEYQCIGANRSDSWGAKWAKLTGRQFPLLHKPATEMVLRKHGLLAADIRQALCMKMQLFLPAGFSASNLPAAYRHVVRGSWIRPTQLASGAYHGYLFAVPKKTDWFLNPAGPCAQGLLEWMSLPTALTKVDAWHARKSAPMVYLKAPDGLFSRVFVVWW